jgi:hypothetical protein
MNDRPILVETEHLEDASRIARYIFRQAVAYTANVMGVPIYNSDDMGSVRFVYNKYPELVLGFMQTLSTLYTNQPVKGSVEVREKLIEQAPVQHEAPSLIRMHLVDQASRSAEAEDKAGSSADAAHPSLVGT